MNRIKRMGEFRPRLWAPIAIFAFKRADLVSDLLDSLSRCEGFAESDIFIFVDGPRRPSDNMDVAQVRSLVNSLSFGNVKARFSEKNVGLKGSIGKGVSELVQAYGRVIVLEDDLVVSSEALKYFNEGLEMYADDKKVMSICGYMYNVPEFSHQNDAMLLPFASSWGWATWARAWNDFSLRTEDYRESFKREEFRNDLNRSGIIPASGMIDMQFKGLIDSWAILWNAHLAWHGGVSLFPPKPLVKNSGFGSVNATHSSSLNPLNIILNLIEARMSFFENVSSLNYPRNTSADLIKSSIIAKSMHCRILTLVSHLGYIRRVTRWRIRNLLDKYWR